jgi:NADPH:quinone reductase-like Zn-dependent oxidoreductase
MKAAMIDSLERCPRFADFAEPVVANGETLVEVTAAGPHPLMRMPASGEHYGSQGTLPMIPGIDGTGRSPDGTRVYFGGVRSPWGTIAQRSAAGSPCRGLDGRSLSVLAIGLGVFADVTGSATLIWRFAAERRRPGGRDLGGVSTTIT